MRILIDIGHPADVHFYKNFIKESEKRGNETKVVVREKDVVCKLMDYYNIDYTVISRTKKGIIRKGMALPINDLKILKEAKKFKPTVLTGFASPYISQISKILKKPSIIFTDTEHSTVVNYLSIPLSTHIITPTCFTKDFGEKHIRFRGYKELAYLHPNRFRDKGIGKKNIIIRSSSWESIHDRGSKVFQDYEEILSILKDYGEIVYSTEGAGEREPEKIHSLLKNARLYIGDGATMAAESAVLGVPSIYISKFSLGYLKDLERSGLAHNFKTIPKREDIVNILDTPRKIWSDRRKKMLADKIDVTDFMLNIFENINGVK